MVAAAFVAPSLLQRVTAGLRAADTLADVRMEPL
jgi:hypothetical protein